MSGKDYVKNAVNICKGLLAGDGKTLRTGTKCRKTNGNDVSTRVGRNTGIGDIIGKSVPAIDWNITMGCRIGQS